MRRVKKSPTQKAGTTVAPDAIVRFEVFHNGQRIARAGVPGHAVLSTCVTWVRRDVRRAQPGADVRADELYFHVGGLDSNDPAWSRHVDWSTPSLKLGDRIEVRISDNPRLDPPAREHRYPNQKPPEPPPAGDPTRTDIRGATLWPAPSGAYLRAFGPGDGGPVTLSREEAIRMAKALTTLAASAPVRRSKGTRPRRP